MKAYNNKRNMKKKVNSSRSLYVKMQWALIIFILLGVVGVWGATTISNTNSNFDGNVTASYFIGDGSRISNINTSGLNFGNITVNNINKTGILYPLEIGLSDYNLTGYWSMEDLRDYSPLSNDINICTSNCPTYTSGKFGRAYYFDPINSTGLTINDKDWLDFGTNTNFTYNVWFKPVTTNTGVLIAKNFGGQGPGYGSRPSSTGNCWIGDGSNVQELVGGNVVLNQWNMLTCRRNGTTLSVYVNGNLANSTDSVWQSSDLSSGSSLIIGNRGSQYFNGSIDEIMIFKRSLNSDEVKSLYESNYQYVSQKAGKLGNFYFGSTYGALNYTAPNRPLVSDSSKSVTVCSSGCNYNTIQSALNDVPLILKSTYTINVRDGTYNEDVYVPPFITSFSDDTEGSVGGLSLTGNSSDINGVKIKSLQISNAIGQWAFSGSNFQVTGLEPTSDEGTCISAYGAGTSVIFQDINVTCGGTYGIMGYGSQVYIHSSYFNGSQNYALLIKRGGSGIFGDDYLNSWNVGSVKTALVATTEGFIDVNENNQVSAPQIVKCNGENSGLVTYRSKIYCIGTDNSNGFSSADLLAYYPLDNYLTDLAFGKTQINSVNNYRYTFGKYGYGANSSVANSGLIGNHSFSSLNGTTATVSVWINKSADFTEDGAIILLGTSSGSVGQNNFIYLAVDDSTGGRDDLQFGIGDSTFRGYCWSPANETNTYNGRMMHYAFTLNNNGVCKYYRNGQLISTNTIGNGITSWNINSTYKFFAIGSNFTGTIDSPMIFNRTLSDGEIESLYETFTEPINKDAYLLTSGGTVEGNLLSRNIIPSLNNTYSLGNSSNRYASGFIFNLTTGDINFANGMVLKERGNDMCFYNATGSLKSCMNADGSMMQNTTIAKPTCDATQRGKSWITFGGAGVADVVEICIKTAIDTYLWSPTI